MTTRGITFQQQYGDGVPVATAAQGTRYFDTSASPYNEYVMDGGAWVPVGGGGGGGGNGFTASGGGTAGNWTATPPDDGADIGITAAASIASLGGNANINAGDGDTGGGGLVIQAGSAQTSGFGGLITITAGASPSSDGGSITIVGAGPNGGSTAVRGGQGPASVGGDVIISAATGLTNGNIILGLGGAPLPIVDPGVSGALWNNAGVLNISP